MSKPTREYLIGCFAETVTDPVQREVKTCHAVARMLREDGERLAALEVKVGRILLGVKSAMQMIDLLQAGSARERLGDLYFVESQAPVSPDLGEYANLVDHHPGHRVSVEQQRVDTENETQSTSDCAPGSDGGSLELSPDGPSERAGQRDRRVEVGLAKEGEGRESLPTHTRANIKAMRRANNFHECHDPGTWGNLVFCTKCGLGEDQSREGWRCPFIETKRGCPGRFRYVTGGKP